MKTRIFGRLMVVAALIAGGALASTRTSSNTPRTDEEIAGAVRHQIVMYPMYSIFDDVAFHVVNGQVELTGDVTQPYKKSDLTRLVRQVPGVASLTNNIQVLPLSTFDDRLRIQVARAVYSNPVLSRYAMMPVPSIHIIVHNGHITLTGAVSTDMDKQVAGMRANGAGLSFGPVINNLVVEKPAKKS